VDPTRLPVFWVCGAAGAGKSVTAWALFQSLAGQGVSAAYVDIDQLGMVYPAIDADPRRDQLKARALASLVPGYAAAGAQVLVVSGVIDTAARPDLESTGTVGLTLCLISPGATALRARITARGWGDETAAEVVAEDATLRRAPFVDAVVETSGLTVPQVTSRLREYVTVASTASPRQGRGPSAATLPVVMVTGPRLTGSSTLGFGLAQNRWRAGQRTGFVDIDQLCFIDGPVAADGSRSVLAIRQFVALHEYLAAQQVGLLIASAHLGGSDEQILPEHLPAAPVRVLRLRADAATLRAHGRERLLGRPPLLAGDDLAGANPKLLEEVVARALADQAHLDALGDRDRAIDVTRHAASDAIAEIERHIAAIL